MNLEQLRKFKPQIQSLARQYHIDPDSIRVFGSVARGDARPDSDVDLLVHTLPGCSLFDLGGMYMDCMDILGREVNVVCDDSLKPRFAHAIQDDITPLRK